MNGSTSTLLLTKSDVEKVVSMKAAIEAMRRVFVEHAKKGTKTYPRVHIPFDKFDGSIGYMESAVDNLGYSVSKIASLYHQNPSRNLPRIIALITLSRIDNGVPVAVMDGNYLTMLRTGAAAALAADHLAPKDASYAGIIGAGVQGRGQLNGLIEVRPIRRVKVYDISRRASEQFAGEVSSKRGIEVEVAASVEELKECDVIASATPSKTPLVTEKLSHPGLHVNSVGVGAGLGKREVDYAFLRKIKVFVDDIEVAKMDSLGEAFASGALDESSIYGELGELVTGKKKGREAGEVTIFISAGMAIQDLAVAQLAYEKCLSAGLGRKIDFFA